MTGRAVAPAVSSILAVSPILSVSPPVRSRTQTADIEAAHAQLSRMYAEHAPRLSGDRERFQFETRSIHTNLFGVDHGRYTMTAEAEAEAQAALYVTRVLRGRFRFDTVTAGPGDVVLTAPDVAHTLQWSDLRWQTVRLDQEAVLRLAADLLDTDGPTTRFTLSGPLSPARLRYWQAVLDHVSRDVLGDATVAASPLARAEAFRMVAGAALHTFPNTALEASTDPQLPGPGAVEPAVVRRAVEFIDAHAAEAIGLARIAAAARVGPRGLQLAFRRHRGVTPLEYVRTVRMERARADLLAADPAAGHTVRAIASRWGFTHHGHFAIDYRRRYGCSPSTTLRA